ncbi:MULTISPECIES: hypothetical protein [Nocardiopsis]|uniref:Uncharacterized protein n=2 Tax=Nocardiopsis TaxID=2013 RepID=A0A840WTG6_9ACTN|nr:MULTISPECIES: hypothetical protein [Nocardiopsis]MBB5493438.1 hypothetical protein [Nocardiopsis metallicus]MCK9873052.1 hypothetical protein [Nocardiopsis dassonvillei]MEE2052058.1 hypothetical protein [Nocardiopsis umidischolae]
MSTRGAIAVPTDTGWRGRYHHFDSRPAQLGHELLHLYHRTFDGDHEAMARVLIDDHPAGWANLIALYFPWPVDQEEFARVGYEGVMSDVWGRFPECYCHGQHNEATDEAEQTLTCRCPDPDTDCGPEFIEWAYVITPQALRVFSSRPFGVHRLIALVPWQRDNAPDWQAAEVRAITGEIPEDLTL